MDQTLVISLIGVGAMNVGVVLSMIVFGWRVMVRLEDKVEGVRTASETAHEKIRADLGEVKQTLATHTERFNTLGARIDCVEDKIDDLKKQ